MEKKPFSCTQKGCSKQFSSKGSLKNHIKNKHKEELKVENENFFEIKNIPKNKVPKFNFQINGFNFPQNEFKVIINSGDGNTNGNNNVNEVKVSPSSNEDFDIDNYFDFKN
jgi:hypothetical protein